MVQKSAAVCFESSFATGRTRKSSAAECTGAGDAGKSKVASMHSTICKFAFRTHHSVGVALPLVQWVSAQEGAIPVLPRPHQVVRGPV